MRRRSARLAEQCRERVDFRRRSGRAPSAFPAARAASRRSSRAPPSSATETTAASSKSASSVAAQKTGATGMPSGSCSSSASARALSALTNVINGPPNKPGCCPVVTTMPCPPALRSQTFAGRRRRRAIAGASPSSQSRRHAPRDIARVRRATRSADRGARPVPLRELPGARRARQRRSAERLGDGRSTQSSRGPSRHRARDRHLWYGSPRTIVPAR